MYFESALLRGVPGIVHGFGSKSDPVPTPILKKWVELRPTWSQVHGTEIAIVTRKNQVCGEVDGLATKTVNPIAIMSADCVPLLFAKQDGSMVAALHSGWRGTQAKFTEKFTHFLTTQGEHPRDWVAAVGPCIGKCCYEVSKELIEEFVKTFPGIEPDLIQPAHRKLDLAAVNAAELDRLGFGKVDMVEVCTYCSMDPKRGSLLHSYRREGGGTRQWSAIQRITT